MQSNQHQFEFRGQGFEFFKIWIVNILLTIITLGVYSAWAKVRTNRWFYENTLLNNDSFVYLATPLQILKGRMIAVGLFVLYLILSSIFPIINVLTLLAMIAIVPLLLVSFLRFRARNSSYRGIRFEFVGHAFEAIKVYGLLPIASLLTLGLMLPYTIKKQVAFIANNTYYGSQKSNFTGTTSLYWKILFAYIALFVAGFLFGLLGGAMAIMGILIVYVGIVFVGVYIQAQKINTMYNFGSIGTVSFVSTMCTRSLFWIYCKNFFLVLVTLGLYIPFAKVNLARYKAQTLVVVADDLENFVSKQTTNVGVLGAEIADVFDVDMGLA